MLLLFSFSKGAAQNKWGFDTMVNALLKHDVDTLSPESLAAKMKEDAIVLLDAREYGEWRVSHLQNAQHIGYEQLNESALGRLSKDEPIVVYCSVGKRSEDIARHLKRKGFTNVSNLWGGIFNWANQGKDLYNEQGELTNQVHPYNSVWGMWITNSEKAYEPR